MQPKSCTDLITSSLLLINSRKATLSPKRYLNVLLLLARSKQRTSRTGEDTKLEIPNFSMLILITCRGIYGANFRTNSFSPFRLKTSHADFLSPLQSLLISTLRPYPTFFMPLPMYLLIPVLSASLTVGLMSRCAYFSPCGVRPPDVHRRNTSPVTPGMTQGTTSTVA